MLEFEHRLTGAIFQMNRVCRSPLPAVFIQVYGDFVDWRSIRHTQV